MSGEPSSLGAVKPRVLALGVPPPARGPSYSSPGPSPAGGLGASQTSQAQGRLEPSADLIIEAQPVLRSLGSKTTFHGRLPDPQPTKGPQLWGNHHRTLLKPAEPTGFNSAAFSLARRELPEGWAGLHAACGPGHLLYQVQRTQRETEFMNQTVYIQD